MLTYAVVSWTRGWESGPTRAEVESCDSVASKGRSRREKVSLALVVRDAAEKYVMGEAKREGETG